MEQLIKALMKEAVPHSIGVVDTMGCALPETIQYLVRKIKKLTNGLPVEVHTHNDFGMAVATELAGIAAGASCVHSCINGLGERTGNAALEHLMVSMKILLDMPNDYHIEKLSPTYARRFRRFPVCLFRLTCQFQVFEIIRASQVSAWIWL